MLENLFLQIILTLFNMPLQKTYEEILASNLNSRNYSSSLPLIYNLRRRADSAYIPQAASRTIYSDGIIETNIPNGTYARFYNINSTYAKGATITIAGKASFRRTSGAISIIKNARGVKAYIFGEGYDIKIIEALASEISTNGDFSFLIPAAITSELPVGDNYIYLDAFSVNKVTRLEPVDETNNYVFNGISSQLELDGKFNNKYFTRKFVIT